MATLESIEEKLNELQEWLDEKLEDIDSKFDSLVIHSTCSVCQGTGEVNNPVNGEPGPPYTCPKCGGDGSVKSGSINTTDEPES